MRVQSISANIYKFNNYKYNVSNPVISGGGQYPCDTVSFTQKPFQLTADEVEFSLKLSACLDKLDDKSIIYICHPAQKNSVWVLQDRFKDSDFACQREKIKDVYVLFNDNIVNTTNILLIAKDRDGQFTTAGCARNLTTLHKYEWRRGGCYYKDSCPDYGDIIELDSGCKIQFIKNTKNNKRTYDIKYPIEAFTSVDRFANLKGGIVPEKEKGEQDGSIDKELANEVDGLKRQIENLKREKAFIETIYENLKISKQPAVEPQQADKKNEPATKVETNQKETMSQAIPHRTFKDVAGMDDTIQQVKKQILYPMLYPKAFPDVTNCGTIFYGPPGTGKTLLAQAIIGEAKERKDKTINFINIDGQSLEAKWVGDTEKAWRNVFKEAVEKQPCILFIDEIDAILSKRSGGESGGERHRNGVVSQFLTIISDIEKYKHKVWIIGATNRPELIDDAIKRSGRIGNMIEIKKPDKRGCLDILNHYLKGKNISEDFDRARFAQEIHQLGYTGADIANLVNKARDNMYERLGIYEQMDNNTFVDRKLDDLEYILQDFKKAVNQ